MRKRGKQQNDQKKQSVANRGTVASRLSHRYTAKGTAAAAEAAISGQLLQPNLGAHASLPQLATTSACISMPNATSKYSCMSWVVCQTAHDCDAAETCATCTQGAARLLQWLIWDCATASYKMPLGSQQYLTGSSSPSASSAASRHASPASPSGASAAAS